MKALTLDLVEVEVQGTGKVNGPSQKGGLSFGTSYNYFRLPWFKSNEWQRCGDRSHLKIKEIIEHSLANELEEKLK